MAHQTSSSMRGVSEPQAIDRRTGTRGDKPEGSVGEPTGEADRPTITAQSEWQLSKVQSVDQRMRLGMRCRLSPTADVPSHTSGAAMCQEPTLPTKRLTDAEMSI